MALERMNLKIHDVISDHLLRQLNDVGSTLRTSPVYTWFTRDVVAAVWWEGSDPTPRRG
jgi:hypothetical protein